MPDGTVLGSPVARIWITWAIGFTFTPRSSTNSTSGGYIGSHASRVALGIAILLNMVHFGGYWAKSCSGQRYRGPGRSDDTEHQLSDPTAAASALAARFAVSPLFRGRQTGLSQPLLDGREAISNCGAD